VNGRVAVPCSTCGVTVAYVSRAKVERVLASSPAGAAALLAARFVQPAEVMGKVSDAAALHCCTCEAAAIEAAAMPHV
jgi:hypothetical protein